MSIYIELKTPWSGCVRLQPIFNIFGPHPEGKHINGKTSNNSSAQNPNKSATSQLLHWIIMVGSHADNGGGKPSRMNPIAGQQEKFCKPCMLRARMVSSYIKIGPSISLLS